jgi:hypothetical protein
MSDGMQKGRVNVDKDGNPKIVADGEPSMAPENNTDTFEQAFKNSADFLEGCFVFFYLPLLLLLVLTLVLVVLALVLLLFVTLCLL